jgi:hypothetical protein
VLRIEFHFAPNPYFDNDVLVKEYPRNSAELGKNCNLLIQNPIVRQNLFVIHCRLSRIDMPQVCRSTEIRWKSGMDLVKKMGKVSLNSRKRKHNVRTFFSWFTDKCDPSFDDIGDVS